MFLLAYLSWAGKLPAVLTIFGFWLFATYSHIAYPRIAGSHWAVPRTVVRFQRETLPTLPDYWYPIRLLDSLLPHHEASFLFFWASMWGDRTAVGDVPSTGKSALSHRSHPNM